MSLNYNLGKIKDFKDLSDKNGPLALTKKIIFATMFVDIGNITKENFREFHKRYALFNAALDQEVDFTVEDVERHIGLSCNVSTRTFTQYLKRIKETSLRKIKEAEYTPVLKR